MLTPTALATWISFCIPWADPTIAHVLTMAGSGGESYLIVEASGQSSVPATLSEGIDLLRRNNDQAERYIGLTQIPASSLRQLGVPPEAALPECANLSIGWQLWSDAHTFALTKQKTPMKAVALAFNIYRTHQELLETPYSQKAVDMLMSFRPVAPAPFGSRLYFEITAAASNHRALLLRLESPGTQLGLAGQLAGQARTQVP